MSEQVQIKSGGGSVSRAKWNLKWIATGAVVATGLYGMIHWGLRRNGGAGQSETPTVAVYPVKRATLENTLSLTAEFRPYQEVSVHAKVAGFVQSMNVDIGDHVKAGQALAVLEIPELKNDVQRAEAALQASQEDVRKAEANYEESHLAYTRLLGVSKENAKLVAQQDLESAKAKDQEKQSGLAAARQHVVESQAEVDKMRAMLGYATITAPFAGVITKRYADTGALIQSGISSNTQAMPVVDLAEDARLRLEFPVPESAAANVSAGKGVTVFVDSLHRKFPSTIARYSGKVDTSTRTMKAEVDIDNTDGKFIPGMYASVRMPLETRTNVLCVPLQALSQGSQPTVMVLDSGHAIAERPVGVGMETANLAEITRGLHEGDLVVIGNRSGLHPGQKANGKITDIGLQ